MQGVRFGAAGRCWRPRNGTTLDFHQSSSAAFWAFARAELFANLRPAKLWASGRRMPAEAKRLGDGLDLVVCRELVGDVYFGKKWRDEAGAGHDV